MRHIKELKKYITKKCQTIAIYSGAMPNTLMKDYKHNKPTGTRLGYCKYSKTGKQLILTCTQSGRIGYMRITNWFGFGPFKDFKFGNNVSIINNIDCKVGDIRFITFLHF